MSDITASTDTVEFLTSFGDLWSYITLWTVAGCSFVYLCAGVIACRVLLASSNSALTSKHERVPSPQPRTAFQAQVQLAQPLEQQIAEAERPLTKRRNGSRAVLRLVSVVWLPPVFALVGATLGFFSGSVSAILLAAIYVNIPYAIGTDVAAGLGIGQAVLITYMHCGRAYLWYA